jgi:predicted dehydrogenase
MSKQTRRDFIKGSIAAMATITVAGTKSSGRVLGANEAIRVGVAGLNGRGSAHVGAFAPMQDVQITYLIDPDTRTYRSRLQQIGNRSNPRTVQDVRRCLEDRNVDAISIATPNHWHALIAIWACQAGKDVYVEKPCSHNLWEGRQLVRAAQKYQRIVQHGTQSRSIRAQIEAIDHLHNGTFGEIYLARGVCFKRRDTIGRTPVESVPRGVDYDLWTGPAPLKPFTRNRFHYNWHWIWDTGNGDLGNQGVHQVDVARWGLGVRPGDAEHTHLCLRVRSARWSP